MCDKLAFETYAEAKHLVNKANNKKRYYIDGQRQNRRQTYKPKRAYKCEICGLYHLTSLKKKTKPH